MFDRNALQTLVDKRNPSVEAARDAYMRYHMETENPEPGKTPSQAENVAMLTELHGALDEISVEDINAAYDNIGFEDYRALRDAKLEREATLDRQKEGRELDRE